jgi:hypothetical protein
MTSLEDSQTKGECAAVYEMKETVAIAPIIDRSSF